MKLYFSYLAMHIKSLLEYKISFILLVIGQFVVSFSACVAVYFMFLRFERVQEFSFYDVLLCFSTTQLSFSIAECFGRGFDQFDGLISQGSFDRMLVRPRNIIFQVLASTVEFTRLGRVVFAIMVLFVALISNPISWNELKIVSLVLMVLCGTILYFCLFVIFASLSFFTTESLEFMNILTDGSREFGTYPYGIYGKEVLRFLTYVVPLALVQYYPLRYILGLSTQWFDAFLPLLSLVFIGPAMILWRLGRRYYRSTGS